MMLEINFDGIVLLIGNLHCPSSAILAESKFPFLSSKTVHVLLLKRLCGRQKKNHNPNPKKNRINIPFLLFINGSMLLNCFS